MRPGDLVECVLQDNFIARGLSPSPGEVFMVTEAYNSQGVDCLTLDGASDRFHWPAYNFRLVRNTLPAYMELFI